MIALEAPIFCSRHQRVNINVNQICSKCSVIKWETFIKKKKKNIPSWCKYWVKFLMGSLAILNFLRTLCIKVKFSQATHMQKLLRSSKQKFLIVNMKVYLPECYTRAGCGNVAPFQRTVKRTDKYRRLFRPVHKVSTLIRNKNEISCLNKSLLLK